MKIWQLIIFLASLLMISAIALDALSVTSDFTFIALMVSSMLLCIIGWRIMKIPEKTEKIKGANQRKKILFIMIPSMAFGSLGGAWFAHQKIPEFSAVELGILTIASFLVASSIICFWGMLRKNTIEPVAGGDGLPQGGKPPLS